jgi:hypothetical protein
MAQVRRRILVMRMTRKRPSSARGLKLKLLFPLLAKPDLDNGVVPEKDGANRV